MVRAPPPCDATEYLPGHVRRGRASITTSSRGQTWSPATSLLGGGGRRTKAPTTLTGMEREWDSLVRFPWGVLLQHGSQLLAIKGRGSCVCFVCLVAERTEAYYVVVIWTQPLPGLIIGMVVPGIVMCV